MMNDPNMKQVLAIPFETTAFEPNRRIAVRVAMAGGFAGESVWTLTDLGAAAESLPLHIWGS